ncbi:unnamed protein product [Blepharisma stoltei]|uniref:EF-hand domain-containing protein n=1 Tax=Blepharisma stoltei TaxID=1481888 RepID=A0AAU9K477_9CILI|nr:unnamed protein product [Blepharisma stoltei]
MEPLFENHQLNNRPNSAKYPDLKAWRNFRSRPFTAVNKNLAALPSRNKSKADPSKSKSKNVAYSREELYDRAMEFKTQMNLYREENLKLKTKIKILEKENRKEDEENEKGSLLHHLKNQLKDAQKQIENKDLEISELKKASRATRIQEMEVEIKMYIDECTRLKRMLEEALSQLSMGVVSQDLQEKYLQQCIQIKKLKQEIYDMNMFGDEKTLDSKGKKKRDGLLLKMKQTILETRDENEKIKAENMILAGQLKMMREQFKCPNCQFCGAEENNRDINILIWEIWQAIEHRRINLEKAWELLEIANVDINVDTLNEALEKIGLYFTIQELQLFHSAFQNSQKISYDSFVSTLTKLKPTELITYEQIKDTITHLSYRLQVKRWTTEQVPHIFFQESRYYTQSEFSQLLQQEPVIFDITQAELFSRFVFGCSASLPCEECIARLFDILEPWEVLSEAKEYEYDSELRNVLGKYGIELEKVCKEMDKENTGIINLKQLEEALGKVGAKMSPNIFSYLRLLFYTDQYKFDTVPYMNFLSAYCDIKD